MSSPERLDPKYLMGYPPPLTPSQKRAAEMAQKYPGTSKRRKPSTSSITSSSHPLRQTSFPPENPTDRGYSLQAFSPGARSPSIDTMSLVSGGVAAAPIKKKRGRKPKNYNPDADAASVAGGVAPSVAASRTSARAGGASRASRGLSVDEDDDEDGGRGGLDVAVVARTNEEKEKENRYRAMLVGEFDSEQFRRFECWRSARLADSVVRRVSLSILIL
jgi:transcription initiation factor TFIID subunit 11